MNLRDVTQHILDNLGDINLLDLQNFIKHEGQNRIDHIYHDESSEYYILVKKLYFSCDYQGSIQGMMDIIAVM